MSGAVGIRDMGCKERRQLSGGGTVGKQASNEAFSESFGESTVATNDTSMRDKSCPPKVQFPAGTSSTITMQFARFLESSGICPHSAAASPGL